jgi:cyclic beta-1,2-glucan synthetase
LPPPYVSTVDSGNLAGHLIVLRQGYRDLLDQPIIGPQVCAGLLDTLGLIAESLPLDEEDACIHEVARSLETAPSTVGGYRELLRNVIERIPGLPKTGGAGRWRDRLEAQCRSWLEDMTYFLPESGEADDREPPTLAQLVSCDGKIRTPGEESSLPHNLARLLTRHDEIIGSADRRVEVMDFGFLYDHDRRLFAIGYNVLGARLDNSYYDLLASEARLASFIAIAKGDVPTEHWFHLGRALVPADSRSVLVSWGGSMFEYLMPLLVMRGYPATLLTETYQTIVDRQIEFGRGHRVPWGMSESAFNVRDANQNYQYRSFGVPGLGLKSGLGSDIVVTPYATLLALPVRPAAAIANLRAFVGEEMTGP